MKKTVLVFSLFIFAIILLFQFSKYALISSNLEIEIVISVIAIVFFFIGISIHKKSLNKIILIPDKINYKKIEDLDISKREYEVLLKIAEGFSNKEIAAFLFVSESTIKTHVSNLLLKLDAKRRTQAVKIAKSLQII